LNCARESYFPVNLESIVKIWTEHCQLESINVDTFGGENSKKLEKLEVLELSNNHLTKIDDYQFTRASNLHHLELNNNKISSLTRKSFYGLEKLRDINLENNLLTEIYLDDFFHHLTLTYINFARNKISEIKIINKTLEFNAKQVNIFNNQLKDISKLKQLKSVSFLNMGHNPQLINLNTTISEFVDLEILYLTDTNLKQLKNFDFLRKLIKLKYLNLMENDLQTIYFSLLPLLPDLTTLNIQKNRLTNICYECLREKFPKLSKIQISHNDWNCDFLENMLSYFKKENIELIFEFAAETTQQTIQNVECYNQKETTNFSHNQDSLVMAYIGCALGVLSICLTILVSILFYRSNLQKLESVESKDNVETIVPYYETIIAPEERTLQNYDALDL
jgi:Leucine-rich repeat (LRR) protein